MEKGIVRRKRGGRGAWGTKKGRRADFALRGPIVVRRCSRDIRYQDPLRTYETAARNGAKRTDSTIYPSWKL